MNDVIPQSQNSQKFLFSLILVGAMAIGFAAILTNGMKLPESNQLGKQFPPIEATGWINGPEPTTNELRNHVLVVDAWAFWCGPCRAAIPQLIRLHQKYKGQNVVFLGLTTEGEDADSLMNTEEAIKSLRVPWTNGYGAIKTLEALEANEIPQLWIVDQQNRIVFHEKGFDPNKTHLIDLAINKALRSGFDKNQ